MAGGSEVSPSAALLRIPNSIAENFRSVMPSIPSGEEGAALDFLSLIADNVLTRSGEAATVPTLVERLAPLLGTEILQRVLEGDLSALPLMAGRLPVVGESIDSIMATTDDLPLRGIIDSVMNNQ